ncbi:MAG: hypothetical protein Q7W55_00750 [Pseudohongiella sp.]|nr:hypothetical protein [Pseudohongiella sp.]MDO9518901.1 hypothetical protein [Pseudohongiella sp.]MDP2126423.1 hypothetical protein [Pseudohongiella sp.]
MKFKVSSIIIAVGASSLLLAGTASAQQTALSYNYVEGNITKGEIQGFDYTTYGAGLSIALGDTLFLKGTIAEGESDDAVFSGVFSDNVDISAYTLGLGAHIPISSRSDFVTSISYIKNEVGYRGFNQDADGYGIDAGVRSMLNDWIEIQAAVNYVDGDNFDGKFGFSSEARFYVAQSLSLSIGYAKRDEVDGITAGLRFNF